MNTLYVVAASPEQRPHRLPAAQLYIGEHFSAVLTHARHFAKESLAVHILSPKFGLLSQERLIEPYTLHRTDLDNQARATLIESIRGELPRRCLLPLRIIVLAPDNYVSLFRAACLGTRFEVVPIRAPLSGLGSLQQLHWLRASTWPIECKAILPIPEILSAGENARLHEAVRKAATWWAGQLMNTVPPPEATIFADALAMQLVRRWEKVFSTTRGEWPEDITFHLAFPPASASSPELAAPILTALLTMGLEPRSWWKREGFARLRQLTMHFSMKIVSASISGEQTHLFP